MTKFKIALLGNTNSGKTTLLNTLFGLAEMTSNYPGTTVTTFKSALSYKGVEYQITDLPGIYNLNTFSEEEKITRKILIEESFDLIIQIIEPNFKKRSLSLTLELMELGIPIFIVVNKKNREWKEEKSFLKVIQEQLKIQGVSLNCLDKEAKIKLLNAVHESKNKRSDYSYIINKIHNGLETDILRVRRELKTKNLWETLKVLEQDEEITAKYKNAKNSKQDFSLEIKKNRLEFIEKGLLLEFKDSKTNCFSTFTFTDKIDRLLLNKWLGIPIFLIIMWACFQAVFYLGEFPMDLIDQTISWLQESLSRNFEKSLLTSLLIDGVLGGVGSTLVFLPLIGLLFFFISILEQSGYLARVAYLLDNLLSKLGLSGKASVPLLMGFGCNVPAIMATRTLENKKERIITSMMICFFSCGAKLPIYTILIGAFFVEEHRGNVLLLLYALGIFFGIVSGKLLNKVLKNKRNYLILELPSYTKPRFKNIWRTIKHASLEFLTKAGKIILPLSILLWVLFSFPMIENEPPLVQNSYAASIGKTIEPIFKPLGFDWRISTGLISGLIAKEVFISTFGTMYSLGETDETGLISELKKDPVFTTPVVISLLIFILIYTPCITVISVLKQEFGLKIALIGLFYPTILAWILAFLSRHVLVMLNF